MGAVEYIPDLKASGTENLDSMVASGALRKKSEMQVLQSVAASPGLEISVRTVPR